MGVTCDFWMVTKEEIVEVSNMSGDADFAENFLEGYIAGNYTVSITVDKAWDGLNYLMSRATQEKKFPVGFFHLGTQLGFLVGNLGHDDPGARWFNVNETALIADFLDSFNRERLLEHFDPSKMNEEKIYPEIWTSPESFDYLYENFEILQRFFRDATDAGACVITIYT